MMSGTAGGEFSSKIRSRSPDHTRFAGLIFDLDGTLVDTRLVNHAALAATLAMFGAVDPDSGEPSTGMAFIDRVRFLKTQGLLPADTDIGEICAECERQIISRAPDVRPVRPVVDIVRRAHGKLPLGMATSNTRAVTATLLSVVGLTDVFTAVVTREDVPRGKPDPACYLRAAELLGVEPSRCLVYEDTQIGLDAGRAAGMTVFDVRPLLETLY
jgi:HAD superfamily hydrolase (TIGR01509 family)